MLDTPEIAIISEELQTHKYTMYTHVLTVLRLITGAPYQSYFTFFFYLQTFLCFIIMSY